MEYYFFVIFDKNHNDIAKAGSRFRGETEQNVIKWADTQTLKPGQTIVVTEVTPNRSRHIYIRGEQ